ncbi:hypothetical protein ACET3Z_021586 [Daucus carota]
MQGSCSKGANGILKEPADLPGVKKKLDLIIDGASAGEGKSAEKQDPEVAREIEKKDVGVKEVVVVMDDEVILENQSVDNHSSEWELAIGSPNNVVAHATVDGVSVQSGTKACGLFVMRYLKDICLDKELKFNVKWLRRSNLAYGSDELDDIRIEWAKHFLENHAR